MKCTGIEIQYQNLGGDEVTVEYTDISEIEYTADEPACIKTITLSTDTKWIITRDVNSTMLVYRGGELVITYQNAHKYICYVEGEGLDEPEAFHGDCMTIIKEMQIPMTQSDLVYLNFIFMRTQMILLPMRFG